MADSTDTGYIPLPVLYFLFLYQLLKYEYAAGPYTVVGAIIIPTIAFGALLLAPFLDRGPERRPFKRPVAVGLMLLAISATVFINIGLFLDFTLLFSSGPVVSDNGLPR